MSETLIEAYIDGACSGNPGPGGWGALMRYNNSEKTLSGGENSTTNNRMEITAAIEVLKAVKRPCFIKMTTDSQYLKNGVEQWMENWKKRGWKTASNKPVKNQDLWRELDELMMPHKITWVWVKGHSGHTENEIVDKLARDAIPRTF